MLSQGTTPQITTTRTASRSLLRKVAARTAAPFQGECLEDIFPAAQAQLDSPSVPAEPPLTPTAAVVAMPGQAAAVALKPTRPVLAVSEHAAAALPAAPALWSRDDETMLQGLIARRKAAGYKASGNSIGGQILCVGGIKPNPNTIVAVIVALVSEQTTVARAELVSLMAAAAFPHPKARPTDPNWCQGYVAGAIRSGFLTVADAAVAPDGAA